jgi:glycosyltransferase involved in cell wall biosynthesis
LRSDKNGGSGVFRIGGGKVRRLCVVQPLLSNYSRETFLELADCCKVDLVFSPAPKGTGFGDVQPPNDLRIRYFVFPTLKPLGKKLGLIQWGVCAYIRREKPDAIVMSATPQYLSFWTALLLAKLLDIPAYAHGHGIYKKNRISYPYRLMTTMLLRLVTSYICYAPIVRDSFIRHGFDAAKLSVAHNSMTNHFPVRPEEKTGQEVGVFFIGRLRADSGLELLVRALERLRRIDGVGLTLQVIGSGEQEEELRKQARDWPWVELHGQIYDQRRIRKISLNCFVGCYPGNAGLSVIHMMSLSLPVITHCDLKAHGPEPSLIQDGSNGLLYDHHNPQDSLYDSLKFAALNRQKVIHMQRRAFDAYQDVANPSLAKRLWSIVGAGSEDPRSSRSFLTVTSGLPDSSSRPRTGVDESRFAKSNRDSQRTLD